MKTPNRQRGGAAVEFGLLLIPMVILAFSTAEYGRAVYQYNAIAKSTRDAARYLSQFAPGDATRTAEAKCLVTRGDTSCTLPELLPGLASATVTVSDRLSDPANYQYQKTGRGIVNLVSVAVTGYTFTTLIPVPFIAKDITFGQISATMTQVP
jgi:Flp pilus assembly protein TadG